MTDNDHEGLPRVTAILTACGLRAWPPSIGQADRDWYLARGTAIHAATVLFDAGTLDEASLDPRIVGFVAAYKRFRSDIPCKIIEAEYSVVSQRWGYRGTLDRVLALQGHGRTVIDIKTNEADVVTRLQTAAYATAFAEEKRAIHCRGAVGLKEDGTYRLAIYDDFASDKAAWLACVQLAAWKRRNDMETAA